MQKDFLNPFSLSRPLARAARVLPSTPPIADLGFLGFLTRFPACFLPDWRLAFQPCQAR
jgi:hypothetical protein